jgi:hypothetical protein
VFFTGVGVTAALVAVTAWSGADAISAKNALPRGPTEAQEDDGRSRARRTDFLLLGAGLAGAGTAVLGAVGTAWRRAPAVTTGIALAPAPLGRGASASLSGRF